jgi:hypothetical protein
MHSSRETRRLLHELARRQAALAAPPDAAKRGRALAVIVVALVAVVGSFVAIDTVSRAGIAQSSTWRMSPASSCGDFGSQPRPR